MPLGVRTGIVHRLIAEPSSTSATRGRTIDRAGRLRVIAYEYWTLTFPRRRRRTPAVAPASSARCPTPRLPIRATAPGGHRHGEMIHASTGARTSHHLHQHAIYGMTNGQMARPTLLT